MQVQRQLAAFVPFGNQHKAVIYLLDEFVEHGD